MQVIEAGGLSKGRLLIDLDLSLETGEGLAISGAAGAGKSSLLRILAGLARPDSGRLRVFGQPPGTPAALRRLGYCPTEHRLPRRLTVEDWLSFHCDLLGSAIAAPSARIDWLLDKMGIAHLKRSPLKSVADSEARALQLSLAFLGRPELLLLDEPFAGLGDEGRRRAAAFIGDQINGGGSVIVCSREKVDLPGFHHLLLIDGRLHETVVAREPAATQSPAPSQLVPFKERVRS